MTTSGNLLPSASQPLLGPGSIGVFASQTVEPVARFGDATFCGLFTAHIHHIRPAPFGRDRLAPCRTWCCSPSLPSSYSREARNFGEHRTDGECRPHQRHPHDRSTKRAAEAKRLRRFGWLAVRTESHSNASCRIGAWWRQQRGIEKKKKRGVKLRAGLYVFFLGSPCLKCRAAAASYGLGSLDAARISRSTSLMSFARSLPVSGRGPCSRSFSRNRRISSLMISPF